MELLALLLVIVGTLFISIKAVVYKWLKKREAITENEALISSCAIGAALCLLWFITPLGPAWNDFTPQAPDVTVFWIAICTTTVINLVIQFAQIRSLSLGEASFVAPIAAMTPGLVVLTALFLGEVPGRLGLIGIALIVLGTYLHVREGEDWKDYLKPLYFWNIFGRGEGETPEKRNRKLALRWAYVQALCGGVALIFDGLVGRHGDPAFGATVVLGGLAIGFAILPMIQRNNRSRGGTISNLAPRMERFRTYWLQVLSMGIFFGLPVIFFNTAFRLAPIAYVGSLKRVGIIMTVLLGIYFLDEVGWARRRVVLAGIVVVGAVLLALDPTQAFVLNSADEYLAQLFGK